MSKDLFKIQNLLEKEINILFPEFTEGLIDSKVRGEILPNITIASLTFYVVEKLKSKPESKSLEKKISNLMERLLITDNEYLIEAVNISFLENLDMDQDYYKKLRKSFGPLLLKEAKRLESIIL